MSVPSPGSPRHSQPPAWRRDSAMTDSGRQAGASRWATIRYAIDSNSRTVRLCTIMLVAGFPPAVVTWLLGLHH
jgi:hypothetical protein